MRHLRCACPIRPSYVLHLREQVSKGGSKRDESGAAKREIAADNALINRLNRENDMDANEKLRRAIEDK